MKFKIRVVTISVASLTVTFLFLVLDKHNQTFKITTNVERNILESPSLASVASPSQTQSPVDPWALWAEWVKVDSFYTSDAFWSSDMNVLLNALASTPITAFDVGYKGTQLKATMQLGTQKTIFKPKRYPREVIIEGDPCKGLDMHTAEIVGFHLDGILDFRIAPPVAGRKINLNALRNVTSKALLETYFTQDDNVCFYGVCLYCKPAEAVCADGDLMEGSVTIWLPPWYELATSRHPYQRTYIEGRKARWEMDENYCKDELLNPTSKYHKDILEYTDTCIFDFLMGNADRHHYETYAFASNLSIKLVHLDNGKSFRNPFHDELSILAPLRQCCRLRHSTWTKLLQLKQQGPLSLILERSLKRDPLYPILTQDNLVAIDQRHRLIIDQVMKCIDQYGNSTVIVDR